MDKIIYQGQPMEAQQLSYMELVRENKGAGCYGQEALLRDPMGRYYLRRETYEQHSAQAAGKTTDAFVADLVAGWVDTYEDTMIVHPQTGTLLHADSDELFTSVHDELTALPKRSKPVHLAAMLSQALVTKEAHA